MHLGQDALIAANNYLRQVKLCHQEGAGLIRPQAPERDERSSRLYRKNCSALLDEAFNGFNYKYLINLYRTGVTSEFH